MRNNYECLAWFGAMGIGIIYLGGHQWIFPELAEHFTNLKLREKHFSTKKII